MKYQFTGFPHNKMAQGKRHKPTSETRKLVETLAGYGLPHEQIAILIENGIDRDTLAKHYSVELIAGKAKACAKVGQTLFKKAVEGDTAAMIWWSKAQMRWKDTVVNEHTGKDGKPLELPPIVLVRPSDRDNNT